MHIRPATIDDIEAIATIHVSSWRATYRGMLPDEVIDALSVDERAARWREWIGSPALSDRRYMVIEVDGAVRGFTTTGPSRDDDARGAYELYAIYLDPAYVGRGHGAMLLGVALGEVATRTAPAVTLWVLEGNARARRFYEAAGFVLDGATKTETRFGGVRELRYRLELPAA